MTAAARLADAPAEPLIRAQNLERRFVLGGHEVRAVRDVSLDVEQGEYVSIIGPSGSGKSTLMYMLGCLDTPTSGSYQLAGNDVSRLSDAELAALRNELIGFVFQQFSLLPRTTAVDNVALPLRYAGVGLRARRRRAADALTRVGLGERLHHPPDSLSGGERQRVAIARAIISKPRLLLADEPTGNLDRKAGDGIVQLFEQLNRDLGATIILVTHDPALARRTRRRIEIVDGAIVRDGPPEED